MAYDTDVGEDLEVAQGYLTSQLTDHIRETPEGFLVVADCPVARTGWQQYAIRDLPQKRAADLGVDVSNPNASIELYRPASEVFHPEFLASLEGKPVVDGHPPGFVTPENFSRYAMGHVQNVRRGLEPMEDGEWPILADLVISGEPLVSKVRNKQAREVSLGYDYGIDRDGERINQINMMANHTAVVPKGRAGDLIAIGDEADAGAVAHLAALDALLPPTPTISPPIAPPAVVERAATSLTSTAVLTKKESKPVPKNILKHLLGLGLKTYATDAEPEDLASAAEAVNNAPPEAEDKKKTADLETISRKPESAEIRDAHRAALHDALDAMMDGKGSRATDADVEELKGLLKDAFGEEEEAEPEQQTLDADPSEIEELIGEGEEPDAEDAGHAEGCEDPDCPGCDEADPGEELEPSGEETLESEDRRPANDSRGVRVVRRDRAPAADAAAGVKAVLKMLRPFVARANDDALSTAFNTALSSVTKSSRASAGNGYGRFRAAASDRTASLSKHPNLSLRARAADAASRDAKLQKAYDDIRLGVVKGGK